MKSAVANRLNSMPGEGDYGNTKTRTLPAEKLATEALQKMIVDYGLEKFEGQSYVKDFVSTYEEAEKKVASYEDGLAILSDEDYFRLVKKRGNLEFYSII